MADFSNSSIDFNDIKLIIWDLDETFWNGTIGEGDVQIPEINIQFLKKSTDRGIINSICSKNDRIIVEKRLKESGIWDLFVFPSIDWTPKGDRIQALISNMALRPQNCLFIDDNIHNLEEALFVNPKLIVGFPNIITSFYASIDCVGKDDRSHSRLKQYKVMEEKFIAREHFTNNRDFLLSSRIIVDIHSDCLNQIERIHELILRTNQLNYTKDRISLIELRELLTNTNMKCGYVTAKDKFGDYGIVGFFAVSLSGEVKQFCFSCRTLGMGVEQYIYAELGFPQIETIGDVVIQLDNTTPDWINNNIGDCNKKQNCLLQLTVNAHALIKGPCDMLSIFSYINAGKNIDTEFTYICKSTGVSIESYNHTIHIINSLNLTENVKNEIIEELPFADEGFFRTQMFVPDKYSVVLISLLLDASLGIYKRKKDGTIIAYGEWKDDFTDPNNWESIIHETIYTSNCKWNITMLKAFASKYEYMGRMEVRDIINNVRIIRKKLQSRVKLVFLTGSEIEYEQEKNKSLIGISQYYKDLNNELGKIDNVEYISFSKYISDQECFYESSNHFSKKVYYDLASDIVQIISEKIPGCLSQSSRIRLVIEELKRKIADILPSKLKVKLYYLYKLNKK